MFARLRSTVRYWWRVLNDRCILCNTPIERGAHSKNDVYYPRPNMRTCRKCNKRLLFGTLYGIGWRTNATHL